MECPLTPDLVGAEVDHQVVELAAVRRRTGLVASRPPEDGADPGHQLVDAERLGHVVVTLGQAGQLVGGGIPGGEEEDRGVDVLGPEAAADLESLDVREHHVEDDEVEARSAGLRQRLPAGRGVVGVEPSKFGVRP
jgi:hypothetical protein